ncbi:MAG: hypothetical protein ACTSXD_07130 [Candidatus Heimdallarchaeaceae archaeon]
MKKGTNLLLASVLVVTLASIFSIGSVSAADFGVNVSFVTPSASARISDGYVANVTNITFDAMVNCSFYVKSAALTANTTWALLNGTAENESLTHVAAVLPSALIVEDGTDYTLNATCRNSSNDLAYATVAITIDNTIPTTPTLSPTDQTVDTDGTINFTATLAGENTTSCTLYFDGTNPGSTSYTMNHVGDTCSYTLTGIPETTYKWYVENSDGTNTTNSATNTVNIDTDHSNIAVITDEVDEEGFAIDSGDGIQDLMIPTVIIGVIVLIGIWIAKRK